MKKDRTKANPIKAVLLRFGSYLFSDYNSKTVFCFVRARQFPIEKKPMLNAEYAPIRSVTKL